MSNHKMVNREFAVALGFICIALAASLIGTISYQTFNFRADLAYRDRQISSLQNQVSNYADIANLKKVDYWLVSRSANEPAGSYVVWNFMANYAGYVWVNVESSTTASTYIEVYYQSHGAWYDKKRLLAAAAL